MKYYSLDDWNNGNSFLTILKAGRPRIRVLAMWFSAEAPLPGLLTSAFSLCPEMAKSLRVGKKANSLVPVLGMALITSGESYPYALI